MKKLIAWIFCATLVVTAVQAQAQQSLSGKMAAMNKALKQKVQEANDKRFVKVHLKVQKPYSDKKIEKDYWSCPAIIFNKEGALAFDGDCWGAFEEAAILPSGPVVHFSVELEKFGKYTSGPEKGKAFYFNSIYVDGEGDGEMYGINEAFKRSADKSYIIYKLSLFNDPKQEGRSDNSEVKQAIANYYKEHNLKEVTAQEMANYFHGKQVTPTRKVETFRL